MLTGFLEGFSAAVCCSGGEVHTSVDAEAVDTLRKPELDRLLVNGLWKDYKCPNPSCWSQMSRLRESRVSPNSSRVAQRRSTSDGRTISTLPTYTRN